MAPETPEDATQQPATPEGGQEKPRWTVPAITDVGCWTLTCSAAVVTLLAVVALRPIAAFAVYGTDRTR